MNSAMAALIPVLTLLSVVVLSLTIVRVATVALVQTGLARDLARFEARSAFTGSGYTTTQSEKIVNHPVRRRIIMLLMLLGNAGFVTAISSLILALIDSGSGGRADQFWPKIVLLFTGLALVSVIAYSDWVDRWMSRIITWALRRFTRLDVRDYVGLLHLSGDFEVAELTVQPGNWLAEKSLLELKLIDEGVIVLGIERPDGTYIGTPRRHDRLRTGDTIVVYGPHDVLDELDERPAGTDGNWAHHQAVEKQHRAPAE